MSEPAKRPAHSPRARLESAIEAGIALLDLMDGDTDLEVVCEDEGAESGDYEPDGRDLPAPDYGSAHDQTEAWLLW